MAIVKKIEPNLDLYEYLKVIKTEYNGIGVAISMGNIEEVANLFEEDQRKNGIIEEKNYEARFSGNGFGMPVVLRKSSARENLNYLHYAIKLSEGKVDDYIENKAKKLISVLDKINGNKYMMVCYIESDELHLLVNVVDEDGNEFVNTCEDMLKDMF